MQETYTHGSAIKQLLKPLGGCYRKKEEKKNIREIIKSSIYHLEKHPTWPRSQHKHYLHWESDKDTFQLRAKQVPNALEDKSIEIITFNHIRQTGNSILCISQQMTVLYTKSQATVRPWRIAWSSAWGLEEGPKNPTKPPIQSP